jgi:hypothetical protein
MKSLASKKRCSNHVARQELHHGRLLKRENLHQNESGGLPTFFLLSYPSSLIEHSDLVEGKYQIKLFHKNCAPKSQHFAQISRLDLLELGGIDTEFANVGKK